VQAAERLLAPRREKAVRVVALYLPAGSEMDTKPLADLLSANGVMIVLPRVRGGTLEFAPGPPTSLLAPGFRGLLEPAAPAVPSRSIDLIVLPGLGFDLAGYRLGRGGGHYDGALAELRGAVRVGFGFDCQVVERLPRDRWDQRLDALVTEARTLQFPSRL